MATPAWPWSPETRCQPTQTAVTKAAITLPFGNVFEGLRVLCQTCGSAFGQVQCGQCIGQRAAHQKFHRQIHHTPRFLLALLCLRGNPAPGELCACHLRRGEHQSVGVARSGSTPTVCKRWALICSAGCSSGVWWKRSSGFLGALANLGITPILHVICPGFYNGLPMGTLRAMAQPYNRAHSEERCSSRQRVQTRR